MTIVIHYEEIHRRRSVYINKQNTQNSRKLKIKNFFKL